MHAAMMARQETKRKQEGSTTEQKEQKESLEKKREVFTGALMQWMSALAKIRKEKGVQLSISPSRELGAYLLPCILGTLLVGCGELKTVDCSEGQEAYINHAVQWVKDHPEEIQSEMEELWPGINVTSKELISHIETATFQCGVQKKHSDDIGGCINTNTEVITIDVSDKEFEYALENYENGAWIWEEYQLGNFTSLYRDMRDAGQLTDFDQEWLDFLQSINLGTCIVMHELAHIPHGAHTKENEKIIDQHAEEGTVLEIAIDDPVDVVYAWGGAAYLAAAQWAGETYNSSDDEYWETKE